MGAEQSTPTETTTATTVAPIEKENVVPAPAAALAAEKPELPPAVEKKITVSLADVHMKDPGKITGKRSGERPNIGSNSPSDEGALSQASTRSTSVPLSFRFSKQKRQDRVGVSLHSGDDCDGVVITGVQEGAINGVGARPGDKVVSINGVPVKTATQAGEVLRKVVGDCEVIVERIEDEEMEA